jgi:putative membrane protein
MVTATQMFSPDDRAAISAAVAAAEQQTSGEIVPVVANASDRYERAEDLVGAVLAVIAVCFAWVGFQRLRPAYDWEGGHDLTLALPVLLAIAAVAVVLGILLARAVPECKRLAIAPHAATASVLIAAHHAFDALHVGRTAASTGIVLYVSLLERRVCVWADQSVSAVIHESEWQGICDQLTKALKAGRARDGFVAAIARCGELLGKHFPRTAADTNELTNELRILA